MGKTLSLFLWVVDAPTRLGCFLKGHRWDGLLCTRCMSINLERLKRETDEYWSRFTKGLKEMMDNPNSELRQFIASKQTPEQRALFNQAKTRLSTDRGSRDAT